MDALTIAGGGLVALSALTYVGPKAKAYLASRNSDTLPHDHVKALIGYFTKKKCSKGVKASVDVGKLLYEECYEHEDEVTPPIPVANKLP